MLQSMVLETVFLATSATSRLRTYHRGVNIRNFEDSGWDVTSSLTSTSLHYLFSTANIHQPQWELPGADRRKSPPHDNFLKDIYWPQLSDDIDFKTRERFNNLQKLNIATRDLQQQEPQDEEDIEQPPGVRPPIFRHHPQAIVPPQEQHPPPH